MSFATPYVRTEPAPLESIWGFSPDGNGSGLWEEILGPLSKPFPHGIIRPSSGASVSDGSIGYYLGGWTNGATTPSRSIDDRFYVRSPGFLRFDFGSLTLTNTSDTTYPAGRMIDVSNYGNSGLLFMLGGGDPTDTVGFNNISIYDKTERKWYSQLASGRVPDPRAEFCVVGIQGKKSSSFEM